VRFIARTSISHEPGFKATALHSSLVSVTIPADRRLDREITLKLRAGLLLILFAHVLLHPWVHAMGTAKLAGAPVSVSRSSNPTGSGVVSREQCELCRAGHNATLAPKLPQADLLNPIWIRITFQAVNFVSLQADRRLPSRAPPIL
jgi:hypothetical protein